MDLSRSSALPGFSPLQGRVYLLQGKFLGSFLEAPLPLPCRNQPPFSWMVFTSFKVLDVALN